jgi:hypothetical protein
MLGENMLHCKDFDLDIGSPGVGTKFDFCNSMEKQESWGKQPMHSGSKYFEWPSGLGVY